MTLTLRQRGLWNSVSHFAAIAVNTLAALVIMPVVVHGIGITHFGVWAIASTLVGYAGLLDLGLGQTLIKKSSEWLALNEPERLREEVNSIFTLYALLSIPVILILGILIALAPQLFAIAAEDTGVFRQALLVVGVVAAVGLPMSIFPGLVGGLQDFYFSNALGAGLNVLKAVLTIVLLSLGYGLIALLLLGAAVSFLGWLGSWLWVRRKLSGMRISLRPLSAPRVLETLRFAASMSIWAVAGQSLQALDRLILGIIHSAAGVGIYEIGARLNTFSRTALNVVFIAVPAASTLQAQGKEDALREAYLRGTKYVFAGYGVIFLGMAVFGSAFVGLWMGPGFDVAVLVAQVLMLATWFQSQNSMGHAILVGMGRLRFFTGVMVAYPIAVIALCVTLGLRFGALGVAIGILLAIVLLESVLMTHLLEVMSVPFRQVLAAVHLRVLPALIASTALGLGARRYFPPDTWAMLASEVAAFVAFCAVALYATGMSIQERGQLAGAFIGKSGRLRR